MWSQTFEPHSIFILYLYSFKNVLTYSIYLFSLFHNIIDNSIQFGINWQFQWHEYTIVKNIQINYMLLNNVHMCSIKKKLKDLISYHSVNGLTSWRVISLFQHALEQQWVFSESLMRLHQHVCQLQPVALFMSFCPLQDGKVY